MATQDDNFLKGGTTVPYICQNQLNFSKICVILPMSCLGIESLKYINSSPYLRGDSAQVLHTCGIHCLAVSE